MVRLHLKGASQLIRGVGPALEAQAVIELPRGRNARRLSTTGAIVALLVTSATWGCSHTRGAKVAEHRTYGLSHFLQEAAGRDALDCGTFSFPLLVPPRLSVEQAAAVVACMKAARRNSQPFFFSIGRVPFDSFVAEGLLATASGELKRFRYDGSPCGAVSHCGDTFKVEPCITPTDAPLEVDTCKRP